MTEGIAVSSVGVVGLVLALFDGRCDKARWACLAVAEGVERHAADLPEPQADAAASVAELAGWVAAQLAALDLEDGPHGPDRP